MKEIKVYQCEKCNNAYFEPKAAEKCCTPKICEDCGVEMPPKYYYVVCDPCREKRKLERAEKMTLAEYFKAYPDHYPLFTVDGECILLGDFDCFDDWESYREDERPQYLYGATQRFVELNADGIIDHLNEEVSFEDDVEMFDDDACAEIYRFCEDWNNRNAFEYFEENPKLAVFLSEEAANAD